MDIEQAKRDWELNRLKQQREEEERRAELEEDDMLYTYSKEDSMNQVPRKPKKYQRKRPIPPPCRKSKRPPRPKQLQRIPEPELEHKPKRRGRPPKNPNKLKQPVTSSNVSKDDGRVITLKTATSNGSSPLTLRRKPGSKTYLIGNTAAPAKRVNGFKKKGRVSSDNSDVDV